MIMKKEKTVIGYPFVYHVDQDLRPELSVNFLDEVYTRNYTCKRDLLNHGYYKLMGYKYDFRPYLKKYLYKQNGNWYEVYAPNKQKLRRAIYGKIDRIIELED